MKIKIKQIVLKNCSSSEPRASVIQGQGISQEMLSFRVFHVSVFVGSCSSEANQCYKLMII